MLACECEVDAVFFPFFLCEGALLEDGGAGNNRVTIFFKFVKNPKNRLDSISIRHSVVCPST